MKSLTLKLQHLALLLCLLTGLCSGHHQGSKRNPASGSQTVRKFKEGSARGSKWKPKPSKGGPPSSPEDGADAGCQEPDEGIIRKGSTYNDPSRLITATPRECGCICGRDPKCKCWTRDARTGYCALKDKVIEARRNPNFHSGVVGGEPVGQNIPVDDTCIIEQGVKLKGQTHKSIKTKNAGQCCEACQDDLECVSWTRNRKTGRCELHLDVDGRKADKKMDGGTAF